MRSAAMRKQGFTLIELLVVIAIIAILAAILFPVFINAKKSAQLSACVNNMKQMGIAVNLYLSDFNGAMPQANNIWSFSAVQPPNPPASNDYFAELDRYLKSPSYAICPAKHTLWMELHTTALYFYDPGIRKMRSAWYGATYTPCNYNWKKADPRLLGYGLDDKRRANFKAEMRWSQRGDLVRPDSVDYAARFGTPRRAEVVMLFCMSGTWISFPDIVDMPPDQIIRGPHENGTPVLDADMHSGLAGPVQVGFL